MSSLREFVKKALRNQMISEISEKFAETALETDPSFDSPFSKAIFGDNLRVVVPMSYEGGLFDIIRNNMKERGWDVDFSEGRAYQQVKTKNGVKTRETRIVKALNKEKKTLEKEREGKLINAPKRVEVLEKEFGDRLRQQMPLTFAGFNKEISDELKSIYGGDGSIWNLIDVAMRSSAPPEASEYVVNTRVSKLFDEKQLLELVGAKEFKEELKKFETFEDVVHNKPEFLKAIEDYESHGSGYSIIFSRAPIDILRMSDWKHLQSCHSEPGSGLDDSYGGTYFHCAIEESQTGGAIAYLVKTKDIEGKDLNAEEFFDDKSRGVPGVRPVSRLRLRRFSISGKNDFLASELQSYGSDSEAFFRSVGKELSKMQEPAFKELGYDNENLPDEDEIEMVGGSYTDTSPDRLLNNYFKQEAYSYIRSSQSAEDKMERWADDVRSAVGGSMYVSIDYSHDLDRETYNFSWSTSVEISGLEEWWNNDEDAAEKFWWDAEEEMPQLSHLDYYTKSDGEGIELTFSSEQYGLSDLETAVYESIDEFEQIEEWINDCEERLERENMSDEEGEMKEMLSNFVGKMGGKFDFDYGHKIKIMGNHFDATSMFKDINEASRFFSYKGNPSYYDTKKPRNELRKIHKDSQYKVAQMGGGGKIHFFPVVAIQDNMDEGEGVSQLSLILDKLKNLMQPEVFMEEIKKQLEEWRTSHDQENQ